MIKGKEYECGNISDDDDHARWNGPVHLVHESDERRSSEISWGQNEKHFGSTD